MYISKDEFNTIEKALHTLPQAEEFSKISEYWQNIILNADRVMLTVLKRDKETKKIIEE